MRKLAKRTLGIVVILCMIVTLLPIQSLAADTIDMQLENDITTIYSITYGISDYAEGKKAILMRLDCDYRCPADKFGGNYERLSPTTYIYTKSMSNGSWGYTFINGSTHTDMSALAIVDSSMEKATVNILNGFLAYEVDTGSTDGANMFYYQLYTYEIDLTTPCGTIDSLGNVTPATPYPVTGGNIYFDMASKTILACDTNVTQANIPPSINGVSVEHIGSSAFSGCNLLNSITLPNSINEINDYAFKDCESLSDVYYLGSEEQWNNINISSGNDALKNATIHYNSTGSAEEVGSGKCGNNLTWTLDANGTLTIDGTGAMYDYEFVDVTPWYAYNDQVYSIVIGDGVTTIGNSAFEIFGVQKISIGNSVQSIGSCAFSVGSGNAMVIEFSGNAPTISLQAFCSCGNGLIDIYYNPTTEGWENVINQEYELWNKPIISWIFSDNATDKLPVSDRLSFINAEEYFGGKENGYFITQDDYDRLTANLKWSERIALSSLNVEGTKWFPTKWAGSCYGMSELVALGRLGIISPSDIQGSAQTMFGVEEGEIPISQSTQSLINFYFIQQKIPGIKSVRSEFMKQPQATQISQMEQCISGAEQEGRTALICFKYYSKEEHEVTSHAVLGYAIERGDFELSINETEYQFDRRVLICDPNTAGDQQVASKSALYYNDTQWAMIGKYNVVSTSNDIKTNSTNDTAQLLIVTSDSNYINAIDYKTGERNYTEDTKNAFLSAFADSFVLENPYTHTKYNISKGRFDGTNTIDDEMVIIGNIDTASHAEEETIISIPLNNAYIFTTDEQAVAVSMTYENLYLSANSEAPGTVTFDPKGEIQMKTTIPTNGSLTLTANDNYTSVPWNVITVEAADVTKLSFSQTEQGIVLEGDDLRETTVYGTNDKETVELNFGTEEQKVLITSKENEDDNQLLIMKDTDEDGNFETLLDIINVTSISLDQQSAILEVEESLQLTATIVPSTAQNQSINWKSSNDEVASVNRTGLVTAKSVGIATITAETVDGGHTATCEVTVELPEDHNVPVTGVELNTSRVELNRAGDIYQLKANILPADATNQTVTWTSSAPGVATVSNNGLVTAVSEGTTIITVTTDDGQKVAACIVTVRIESSSSGTGGGGSSDSTTPTSYAIATEDTDGGTITISPKTGSKGQTVTITAVPDDGFTLETLFVSDKNGNEIELTKKTETSYTFKMPASKVTVTATFAEIVVEPEPIVLPFDDILQSAWYYRAVEYVYSNDMMQGTSATTFSPEVEMSRGMIATVLYRLENTPALTDSISFSDVGGDEWYTDSIQWAAENNIMSGYGNNRFGPLDSVTREQLAVILYNYTASEGISIEAAGDLSVFSDAGDISEWAKEAISWAVGVGLLSGKGNGILDPTGTATRAEVAQMLMNYCTKVA